MKLKDKKIEILAVQNIINENGHPEEALPAICPPAWAYYRHLSGKEYYETCRKKSCFKSTDAAM